MKRFIQKTTSVFMSLAMVALIGAPAYATTAESEPEQIKPEIIESVLPDIASEKSTLAVDFTAEEAKETEVPPAVCDHGEEDFAEESEEIETEDIVATPSDPAGTQTPEISTEDILDYIQSEEVQDALEGVGVDIEEFEEELENGDIIITDEPDELTYGDRIQIIVDDGKWALVYGAICLVGGTVLNPVMWIIPPVGAALLVAGIPLGLLMTVIGAGKIITSPFAALFFDGTNDLF